MMFAMVACISEDLPQTTTPQEGDKVTLTFGVQVPEAGSATTRSMASPAITSLHVLVFDSEGYFIEKTRAELVGTTSDTATPASPAARQQFTVTLTKTSQARNIHFVANCTEAGNINFGHEDALISGLTVSGDADAYWQRMSFINGIASDEGTNFNANTLVPLVRNFARISVKESANNFELTGFYVVNTRAEGSVAPYAQNKGEFVEYTNADATNDFAAKSYNELVSEAGYVGFEAGELTENPIESTTVGANNYVYVRETAKNSDPFIIVKGKYNGSTTDTYYKLAFMLELNGTKQPASILRNFSYEFDITSVAKAGYASLDEAAEAEAENNLSFNETTQSLLNISDGKSQLFVSATSVTLVSGDEYILMYKYLPTIGGAVDNSQVSVKCDNNDVTNPIFSADPTTSGTVQSLYDAAVAAKDTELAAYYKQYLDYNYVVLDPRDPQSGVNLTQNVIVSAGELARTVNFTLREKTDFISVVAYDGWGTDTTDNVVPRALKQKVNVAITIPAGLSQSIFPLEFDIEAAALSIYPDAEMNNLPVRTGTSIIPNNTSTTFGFVKTYTWSEYVAAGGTPTLNDNGEVETPAQNVTITTYFRTNKEVSASDVWVSNKYFNPDNGAFTNGGTAITENTQNITVTFSGNERTYYGAGHAVTATISVPNAANEEVTVTIGSGFADSGVKTYTTNANGNITLNLTTDEWSGDRSVTVSCAKEVISGNTITIYNDGSATITANRLVIPAGNIKWNNVGSSSYDIGLYRVGNNSTLDSDIGSGGSAGSNTAVSVQVDNLSETDELYLGYRTGSSSNRRYSTTTITVKQAVDGTAPTLLWTTNNTRPDYY